MEEKELEVETLYMVLKLQKKISYTSPLTGKPIDVPLDGIEGFTCVYKTLEEAEIHSGAGKYQILPIKTY